MTVKQNLFNALPPGFRLHWYEVEDVLGQGGFGVTYNAVDTNLGHRVAIKEFFPRSCVVRDDDSHVHATNDYEVFTWGLERFIQEAQTLAQFRHENIVRVITVFEENGTAYMVMEREEGDNLEATVQARDVDEDLLLRIIHALLNGLEQVHGTGFIHRDVKPDNILVRSNLSPVLLDFGSARQALGHETRELTALVSSGYAPVEQYNVSAGGKQGPWTDIYSLAATFYKVMFERKPPDALGRLSSAFDGSADPYERALEMGRGRYSAALLGALDAALAVRASDRPQSVTEWRTFFPSPASA